MILKITDENGVIEEIENVISVCEIGGDSLGYGVVSWTEKDDKSPFENSSVYATFVVLEADDGN